MKLLANENFPIASVHLLQSIGYDIIAIGTEYAGVTDEYVMYLAENQSRLILTFDRDYGELIYKKNYKPPKGVIYLRIKNYLPTEPAMIIHKLLTENKILTDRALTVYD